MKKFLQFWLMFLCVTVVLPNRGFAEDKSFLVGGIETVLPEATAEAQIFYQAMRLNRASNIWNVEIVIRNSGSNDLRSPLIVHIPTFSGTAGMLHPDGLSEDKPFYDLSQWVTNGILEPGQRSGPRTLSLVYSSGETPVIEARVYGRSAQFALALTHTLNEAGQPLGNVLVEETGPAGTRNLKSDAHWGIITLGNVSGEHWWKFHAPGYLPVWRSQELRVGQVKLLHNPRLVLRSTNTWQILSGEAGDLSKGVQVTFPNESAPANAVATLTMLTGQTLPALLPVGWSPLQAFSLDLSTGLSANANATVKLWDNLAVNESAAVVRWNESTLKWDVLQLVSGNGTNTASFSIPGAGTFLVVSGDSAELAPQVGSVLAGSSVVFTNYSGISTGGKVTPGTSPASLIPESVTAEAQITFTNATGNIPSGIILRGEISERYLLRDGTTRVTPSYEKSIIGYQRPRSETVGTVTALTPLRPLFLFGADELVEATVTMSLFEPADFSGQIFEPLGSLIVNDNLRIMSPNSAFTNAQAAILRILNPTNYLSLSSNAILGVHLDVREVERGTRLQVDFGTNIPNSFFVLSRIVHDQGVFGLEPIERFASTESGVLVSAEPQSGERLSGLTGSGEFLLVKVPSAQALVSGVARNSSGEQTAGILVRLKEWLTFSKTDGSYQLLAPVGPATVEFTQIINGNNAFIDVAVTSSAETFIVNGTTQLSGPRITSVSPVAGTLNVPRVAPVVVAFSKPINPGGLASGSVQLLDENGQPIAASVSLNLRNTVATLLPVAQLAASTLHTIYISTNLAGQNGLPLEGANSFTFTTETDAIERLGAQVISHEPANGIARMEGSPGTADAESPVILVNETSGRTATILSRPDGSFSNFIEADVDDVLAAVIVNQNGTRTTIPVSRQIFRDGSVGLFNGGGILEAQSDGGPVEVLVAPGAIPNKTKFFISPIPASQLLQIIKNTPPDGNGKVLAGFSVKTEGDNLTESLKISVPVTEASLDLPPGVSPSEIGYALVIPREIDGEVTYEVIDRMTYRDGKLESSSSVLPGLRNQAQDATNPAPVSAASQGIVPKALSSGSQKGAPIIEKTTLADNFGGVVLAVLSILHIPIELQGHVWSADRARDGSWEFLRPVRGATVYISPLDQGVSDGSGTVPGGALISVSDDDGSFVGLVYGGQAEDNMFALKATSAFFPRKSGRGAARLTGLFSTLARGSVHFDRGGVSVPEPDLVAPLLRMFHGPQISTINEDVTFTAFATDNRAMNTLSVALDSVTSLNSSLPVANSNIILTVGQPATLGQSINIESQVRSDVPAAVTLVATAHDASGNQASARYRIELGGSQRPLLNSTPDTNDVTSPLVIDTNPGHGVMDFNPLKPIIIRFSEPMDDSLLPSLNTHHNLSPSAGTPHAELSDDKMQLSLHYPNLQGGTTYTLTLYSSIRDRNGVYFDQEPFNGAGILDSFTVQFSTRDFFMQPLPGMISGGGVAGDTNYLYALDRKGPSTITAWLRIYARNPDGSFTEKAPVQLPSYPRDLVLIKGFNFRPPVGGGVERGDFLAIAGGALGRSGQWLKIINVSNPLQPKTEVSTLISKSSSSAIVRLQWSSPMIGYLEYDQVDAVGLIDLQLLLYAHRIGDLKDMEFAGREGIDGNGDGDYVDNGDVIPLPRKINGPAATVAEAGLAAIYAMGEEVYKHIIDFSIGFGGSYVGVIHGPSFTGKTSLGGDAAGYRTLAWAGEPKDPSTGVIPINPVPTRLLTLFGAHLETANGSRFANLSLVSHNNGVTVLDITDALNPALLANIEIPDFVGEPRTAHYATSSGLIYLGTTKDMIVLSASRLAQDSGAWPSPAVVGAVPSSGGQLRSFHVVNEDFWAVSDGSRSFYLSRVPPVSGDFDVEHIFTYDTTVVSPDPNTAALPRRSFAELLEVVLKQGDDGNQTFIFKAGITPNNLTLPFGFPQWTLDAGSPQGGQAANYQIPGFSTYDPGWYLPIIPPHRHLIQSGDQTLTLKTYPDREIKFTLRKDSNNSDEDDVESVLDDLLHALKNLRAGFIQAEIEVKKPRGALTFESQWKECVDSNKVMLAIKLTAALDPLIGVEGKAAYGFYPPDPLNKYLHAGLFIKTDGKLKIEGFGERRECAPPNWGSLNIGGEINLQAGFEAKIGSALEVLVAGGSGTAASGLLDVSDDGLAIKDFKVETPGVSAQITVKALSGLIDFNQQLAIVPPTVLVQYAQPIVLLGTNEPAPPQ